MNDYSLAKLEICDCSDNVAKLALSTIYEQICLPFKMKFSLVGALQNYLLGIILSCQLYLPQKI